MGASDRENEKEADKKISIMLFGLSGDGKTSLLRSLFDQMCYNSINKNDISYSLEFEDKAELPEEVRNLETDFSTEGFFPKGTTVSENRKSSLNFSFILRIKKKGEAYNWPIELNDYAGGSIDVFGISRQTEVQDLGEQEESEAEAKGYFKIRQDDLKKANIILVLVDAIALARCCQKYDSDVGRCAREMNARSTNLTLSSIIEKKVHNVEGERVFHVKDHDEKVIKSNDVTILFLLTKTDASIFDNDSRYTQYKDNNFKELREMVKKIYQKVFDEAYHRAKVQGWSVGIVPVCVCGAGNVTTKIDGEIVDNTLNPEGKINPEGIDTAFMYAIQCIFRSLIAGLEKDEKAYQKSINEAADFLKLDKEDNVVWECNSKFKAWLQNKGQANEYKKIVNNAKTGIEMKRIIQTQIEELKKMRDLIEEGYQFNKSEKGVFDTVGQVTGGNRVRDVK